MILTGFDQLAEARNRLEIYDALPDAKDISTDKQTAMLNRIINILGRAYLKYNTCDKAVIQNEEIVKALLGIDYSGDHAPLPYVKLREILSTPMEELLRQMNRVPSTETNLNVLRIVFALLINGEGDGMIDSLSAAFPQYFRQMEKIV